DLCANGAGNPATLRQAFLAYNHSDEYADRVLVLAASYAGLALSPSGAAAKAVAFALDQLGTPYRWGGEGDGGFDCSGLVQAAYAAAGVRLPRVAQAQFAAGPPVAPGAPLVPGDLVFFGASTSNVSHVGLYLGDGVMVDAPQVGA